MSKSLWESFQDAQTAYNALEKSGSVPDDVKWLCYGLGKQVTIGDFTGPIPDEANVVLMVKYKAWVKCKGKSADDAMREYIQEVDKLSSKGDQVQDTFVSPQRKSVSSSNVVTKSIARNLNSSTIKEGTLFKQRDYVKAWRPRHFVLENNCLNYYVDAQDSGGTPRGSMDIAGCIINHLKVAKVGDTEFYPFTISKEKDSYVLASDSKVEADDWVDKIRMAATNALFLTGTTENSPSRSMSTAQFTKNPVDEESDNTGSYNSDIPVPMSPTETFEGLTPELKNKIEKAVAMLVEAVDVNAPNWESLFEKNGVSAFKRPGEQVCVRGDAILPFGIPAIFKLIVTASRACAINPQIVSSTNVRQISTNTNIQYLQFKQVWPTTARDFCNLTHWRILSDYRVLIFSTSHEASEAPEISSFVRGDLIIGGYVLTATPTGTLIQYVVQSDLKGNIPKSVRTIVSSTQPLIVANIRKVLEEDAKRDESVAHIPTNFTFQDLYNIKVATQVLPPASSAAPAANDGVRQALPNRTAPRPTSVNPKSKKIQRKITTASLLVLLLPVVLYYLVDRSRRALAFFTGLVIAVRYLFYLHLGDPYKRNSTYVHCSPPAGKYVIRFPVELSKLLTYLNGVRKESGLDITITHAVIKAVATVMSEQPGMNGCFLFGNFYPKKSPGVDISLAIDTSPKDSVMVKLVDADVKSLDYIADELQVKTKELRDDFKPNSEVGDDSLKMKIVKRLPVFLAVEFDKLCKFIGNGLGLELPRLGISPYAYGNCTIIAWPNGKAESDVDVALQPDPSSDSPITITIGGIRTMSSLDQEKKLTGTSVLTVTCVIDSRMCSVIEARSFSTGVQTLLNNQFNATVAETKKSK